MNKWKIAFGICFILLVSTAVIGVYSVIDQAVTIMYMKDGYSDTEADLETLIKLINETNLSKEEINLKLSEHRLFEFMDFNQDSIGIERIQLHFKNDHLNRITKEW